MFLSSAAIRVRAHARAAPERVLSAISRQLERSFDTVGGRQVRCCSTQHQSNGKEKCNSTCTIMGVHGGSADTFCDSLLGYGAQAAWVEEAIPEGGAEQPIYADPVRGLSPRHWTQDLWRNCRVVALFDVNEDQESMEAAIQQSARAAGVGGALELAWSEVYSEDWEEQVKASYVPVQVTEDFWIIPEWCEPRAGQVNLRLKPGLAWGTGEHPTTRLCLRWLAQANLAGKTVLDYGAGSGILSVGALLYGAEHVVAVDVDALSVRATQLNAELNGVGPRCEAYVCQPFSTDPEPLQAGGARVQKGFDLCIANILRPALLDLRPRLTSYLRSGGVIALSGLLPDQAEEVKTAYSANFQDLRIMVDGEWALVTGVKR